MPGFHIKKTMLIDWRNASIKRRAICLDCAAGWRRRTRGPRSSRPCASAGPAKIIYTSVATGPWPTPTAASKPFRPFSPSRWAKSLQILIDRAVKTTTQKSVFEDWRWWRRFQRQQQREPLRRSDSDFRQSFKFDKRRGSSGRMLVRRIRAISTGHLWRKKKQRRPSNC